MRDSFLQVTGLEFHLVEVAAVVHCPPKCWGGRMFKTPITFAFAVSMSTSVAAQELALICEGSMRGMFRDRAGGALIVDNQGNMASGSGSTSQYRDVPTVAQFQMTTNKVRLNLPQPPTCGICVGEKGWRDVKKLEVTESRIAGKITYGLFSGTRFEIDRRTGIMTTENGFTGTCKPQDLSERKF